MASNRLQWFYAERARCFQEAAQKLEHNDVGAVSSGLNGHAAAKLFAPAQQRRAQMGADRNGRGRAAGGPGLEFCGLVLHMSR